VTTVRQELLRTVLGREFQMQHNLKTAIAEISLDVWLEHHSVVVSERTIMRPNVTAEVHQCGNTVDLKRWHCHFIFDAQLDQQPMETMECV